MLGTVGGVPILGNAIGEVASPNVGVGEVTVLFVEIVLPKWHLEPMVLERLSYSLCLLMPARQSLLSRSCSRAVQALSASPQQRLVF